jgi:hypothetical protein
VKPFAARSNTNCSSADKNIWNGPFCRICRKKLPDEPNVSVTSRSVSCVKAAATSARANCKSDAAATTGTFCVRAGAVASRPSSKPPNRAARQSNFSFIVATVQPI